VGGLSGPRALRNTTGPWRAPGGQPTPLLTRDGGAANDGNLAALLKAGRLDHLLGLGAEEGKGGVSGLPRAPVQS
jgi:hypothetical protein